MVIKNTLNYTMLTIRCVFAVVFMKLRDMYLTMTMYFSPLFFLFGLFLMKELFSNLKLLTIEAKDGSYDFLCWK